MKLLMGLDLGTTALKVALFDGRGKLLAVNTQEYDLIVPKVNYVEEDAEVYWQSFKFGLKAIQAIHQIKEEDELALAMSAQGETLFFIGVDDKPLRNAIVWMDNRAFNEAREITERFSNETCYKVTGQVSFEPCWPASKILWVRKNEPDVFRRTKKFLLIEDYFIYRMTGELVTEGSLLCSSTYWDIINKVYWKEMLDFLQISEEQLPTVRESGELVGILKPEIAKELGIPCKTNICTGALDQAAGAIGVGNIKEGMFSENIGSALAICVPVNNPKFDPNQKMPLHYFPIPGMYMLHTFTTGGMTLRWYRDKFCNEEMKEAELNSEDAYDLISKEAASIPAGSEGLVMLPHLSGSLAPDVNAKALGVWFGISLKHSKAHFARSIMESIGYVLRRNLDTLSKMGVEVEEIRSLGGGSKSVIWNQIKSDITGKRLNTMKSVEAACLGAALLAGKATGLFGDFETAVTNMVQVKDVFKPNGKNKDAYDFGYEMYRKIFGDLKDAFNRLP